MSHWEATALVLAVLALGATGWLRTGLMILSAVALAADPITSHPKPESPTP